MKIVSIDVGARNLAVIVLESDVSPPTYASLQIKYWNCIDIIELYGSTAKNSNKIPPHTIITMMCKCLDGLESHFTDLDYVVIERQMRRASRNQLLGTAIMTYFICKYEKCSVQFIAASAKLKIDTHDLGCKGTVSLFQNDKTLSASQNKTRRKKMAIQVCEEILKSNTNLGLVIPSSSKKDDLADCFLQAIAFIQNNISKTKKRRTK